MMTKSKKIEFYKIRNIGDRLSVAVDFTQANMKVIFKNVLKLGFPLSLIQAYFLNAYMDDILTSSLAYDSSFFINFFGLIIISSLSSVLMFALIANMFVLYEKDELNKDTGIGDMKKIIPFSGKSLLIILIISILIFSVIFFVAMLQSIPLLILILIGLIALVPSLCLILYPVYFEDISIFEVIRKSIYMGFHYWGSTILIAIIVSLLTSVIQYIFIIPSYIMIFVKLIFEKSDFIIFFDFLSYICSVITSLGIFIIYPIIFVFMAFQYFHIMEKEEGISLKSKINEFENL